MRSKASLWTPWVKVTPAQAESRRKRTASRFSTALLVLERGSQQVRRMIGHGSRTRGTRRWSISMAQSGGRCLRVGCRACWRTNLVTHSPSSCMTRHVASSAAWRRYRYPGADRESRTPQSRHRSRGHRERGHRDWAPEIMTRWGRFI